MFQTQQHLYHGFSSNVLTEASNRSLRGPLQPACFLLTFGESPSAVDRTFQSSVLGLVQMRPGYRKIVWRTWSSSTSSNGLLAMSSSDSSSSVSSTSYQEDLSIFPVSGFPVLHAAVRTLCSTGSRLRPQRDVAQCCLISV